MPRDRQTTDDTHAVFVDCVTQHRGIVRKVAHSYAWHPQDREELTQDILVQLWRSWPSWDASRPVTTWMYRIALNVGISFVRRQAQRGRHVASTDASLYDLVDDTASDPEDTHQLRVLHQLIAAQPPLDRALLLLYLEDRSTREIAEILGISASNVTTRINRLKQRIRDHVAP